VGYWVCTPAHSDLDLESKGDSQSLVISFKNKEIEEAFIKLLKNWGSISSARSYEKPTRYPDNVTPRFRDHTDSLKSWLALIDLIMLNYRKEDNSKEFNNCAKDLDITKSNKLISYEPQSIMAAVADHILGSGLGTCEYCSKPFLKNRKDMKYCSNSCRVRYSQNDKKRKLG
tara:strand:+ start:24 stop:539 length:516 start_codon:yes stop_codon:yes gene_type:complete